ncbi:MAG: hypothetical protein WAL56_17315 [Candidatus Sulfotelmatobacter sp.]
MGSYGGDCDWGARGAGLCGRSEDETHCRVTRREATDAELNRNLNHTVMAESLNFTSADKVRALIAQQIAEAPLYTKVVYKDQSNTSDLPAKIVLFCETCEKDTNWETAIYHNTTYRTGFAAKEYTCRNCKANKIAYHYYWGTVEGESDNFLFFKFGQWPALEERIPAEVKKNLDRPNLNLYFKALRCRNQNLGLGSLAYLRRVVEQKIDAILDMIAQEAGGVGFAPEHLVKLEAIKGSGLFKDKINLASTILPPSLRPGGHNPIDALHDLSSDGIHRRSEEECVQVFDRVRFVFEYLFREIDARRRRRS